MTMSHRFKYEISDVADADQRWNALPNKGSMYCVPTSAVDWMYWLARKGWPSAIAFGPPQKPGAANIQANIVAMATLMGTDPTEGTGGDAFYHGLVTHLA